MSALTTPRASSEQEKRDYHVLIIQDFQGTRSLPLSYATYSVGRDKKNTIVIQDRAASRQHLILLRVPLANRKYIYRVVDGDAKGKASLNGIKVNGKSCRHKDLAPGDKIQMGEVTQITYLIQSMSEEDYDWYFNQKEMEYRSIQEESLDPTETLVTILAN